MAAAVEAACAASGLHTIGLARMRDGVFEPYLANYPYPEMRWLDVR
jgi:hypothetical protein